MTEPDPSGRAPWDLGDAMKHRAPFMDQAIYALLEDVYARDRDREILIAAA